ncbi:MAG TPA: pyridoxamine 5'-phosphate oxidase [Candidatus Binatia bacterium]|nr:pyridoxamine 5'-phosphate oxidase [Candidatus Binatia bacterium]HYQ98384.1 pyridoxamine 5'-phosphate oxidase [Candidatus Nitrosocosmicus sp.]
MNSDPILRFRELLAQAAQLGIVPYNAAAFATTGKDLQPTVRMLLLKDVDDRGLVFYTNLESRKGRQMDGNPRASACFWWPQLRQQVRFEGAVELVSERESDEYFASRPRGSQIGAWASRQSSELSSREELIAAAESFAAKYKDQTVPRPPYWSGYRLLVERIEFWREQPERLHDRELYTRQADGWIIRLLAP